jgi:hypothetical protein
MNRITAEDAEDAEDAENRRRFEMDSISTSLDLSAINLFKLERCAAPGIAFAVLRVLSVPLRLSGSSGRPIPSHSAPPH